MTHSPSSSLQLQHGVFVRIFKQGVLLRGPAGIGKSTLALELIDRGHQLVADDIVEFELTQAHSPVGRCPHLLQNLLAIRDLGILDVSELFSEQAIIPAATLRYIIELIPENAPLQQDIFHPYTEVEIFEHNIPMQKIHAQAHRNLALIVETAIKNYILYMNGQDGGRILENRQQQHLSSH
jgi:HPr kinase/phosphorylase